MVSMNIPEFTAACKELNASGFTAGGEPYTDMVYMQNPNCLQFSGFCGKLQFNDVRRIECEEDFPHCGGRFDIICGKGVSGEIPERHAMNACIGKHR